MRNLVLERIQYWYSYEKPAPKSMRWSTVRVRLGRQLGLDEKTKNGRKQIEQIDPVTFPYDRFTDEELLDFYELVVRSIMRQM